MKNNITLMGGALIVLIGVLLLIYPSASNWLAQYNAVTVQDAYVEDVNAMTPEKVNEELDKAQKYNNALSGEGIAGPFFPDSGIVVPDNYTSILAYNDGVMGYIEIPDIDVLLPIYHGMSENVLKKGIGHMDNTAFPIGGRGTHTVLTGHTGLASSKLFTDLNKLEIGDVFHIIILTETYAYEVDQIIVVEPSETESLLPVHDEVYVTLVTCTPYGINSHRLLVRGKQIPFSADETEPSEKSVIIHWRIIIIVFFIISAGIYLFYKKYKINRAA